MGEYESLGTMLGGWAKDFISDPRVFHNVRRTMQEGEARRRCIESIAKEDVPVQDPLLILSFDIERDGWLGQESTYTETAERFLRDFISYSASYGIVGTFFIQGTLVQQLRVSIQDLNAQQNTIGLHGYRHELWGRTNWVTRKRAITVEERKVRMRLALGEFERHGLPIPKAFRAPNFCMDKMTYELLVETGFLMDSSPPSQRGNVFHPYTYRSLKVFPVSCVPVPRVNFNHRLRMNTAAQFRQMNFDNFIRAPLDVLERDVSDILRYQLSQNIRPHIHMYAHNWEFYQSDHNYVKDLFERCKHLGTMFSMRSVTLQTLNDAIFDGGRIK